MSSLVGGNIKMEAQPTQDPPASSNQTGTSRDSGGERARPPEFSLDLLPAVFEVVKAIEEKDAGKASSSDVTNKLNSFHSQLNKVRENVEKYLPSSTIGNKTLDEQQEHMEVLRQQLKMNTKLMKRYSNIMETSFSPPTST